MNISKIDFDGLFAKDDVKVATEILNEKVVEISKNLKRNFEKAYLSFHQRNGTLFIKVGVSTKRVTYSPVTSAADIELVNAVMFAMRGIFDKIDSYGEKQHTPLESEDNLVLATFKDFLTASKLRLQIGKKFSSEDGVLYMPLVFHISNKCSVKFFLEETPELQKLINSVK